jgi:alpha-tubulin suppressor-like RCC1 family protein
MTTELILLAGSAGSPVLANSLYLWGNNQWGELGLDSSQNFDAPTQVDSVSTWAQISVGGNNGFAVAVRNNGTLWSWGSGANGRLGSGNLISRSSPTQVGALSNWSLVSCGEQHTLSIKTNNTLWAWGSNTNGRLGDGTAVTKSSPVQIGALSTWSQVSAGNAFSLALRTNGTLWAWGANASGQLGDGTTVDRSSPVQVGSLSNWAQVSAGTINSLAVKTDGTLWAWGSGSGGALGDGTTVNKSSPIQIGALSDWAQVSGGANYSLAIKTNGTLWAWGSGSDGKLGFPATFVNNPSPIQIGALSDWAQVAATRQHSLAIKTDGSLWAWGLNSRGQLGINDNFSRSSPVQVGSLTGWTKIAGQSYGSTLDFSMGINAGQLYGWGENATGVITSNFVPNATLPQFVGLDYTQSSLNYSSVAAIRTNNTLWAWGLNSDGQMGDGTVANKSSPVQIGALSDWAQVSVGGGGQTLAVKTNGTLWTWGNGDNGALASNSINSRSSPAQVGSLSDWAQVSASGRSTGYAIKTNGTLWAWGSGASGAIGDNTITTRSSPVQIGALSNWAQVSGGSQTVLNHALAVKTDGTVWAWGLNTNGQLGDGTVEARSSPVQIGALSNWAQASAGDSHSLAVKTDGTLWAWGSNTNGRIGDGTTVNKSSPVQIGADTNWFRVAAGGDHSLAVKTNGTVWAWGRNINGALGNGTTSTTNNSPVQIGSFTSWGSVTAGGNQESGGITA